MADTLSGWLARFWRRSRARRPATPAKPAPARPEPAQRLLRASPQGVVALAGHEGIVPAPYLDSVKVWTYGVGHTAAAGAPFPEGMPKGMPKDVDAALGGHICRCGTYTRLRAAVDNAAGRLTKSHPAMGPK